VTLTLWGAYHRLVRPLEQRRLTVHVSIDRAGELGAVIDAEDLVVNGRARVEWRRSGFTVDYRMHFFDDRGEPCRFDLVQRLDDWTLRAWTELSGTLRRGDAAAWGSARLRVDYRDLSPRTLIEIVRGAKKVVQQIQ